MLNNKKNSESIKDRGKRYSIMGGPAFVDDKLLASPSKIPESKELNIEEE